MVSRVILSSFIFASLALVGRGGSKDSDTGYMKKLGDFSFDMGTMREYPANWNAMGTAIPIMSKVKLVPEIPNVTGQFFLAQELVTPAWDVIYKFSMAESDTLSGKNSGGAAVDLFACWFLLGNPMIKKAGNITPAMGFGWREMFVGVGVYVFKQGDKYKIIAAQNLGNVALNTGNLMSQYQEGVNGCELKAETFSKDFVLHMRMYQSMLTVTYGKKMRASSHKECFNDLFLRQLSNRGYLGVTARNGQSYTKDVELLQVKVSNLDPNFYHEMVQEPDQGEMQTDFGGQEHVDIGQAGGDYLFEEYEPEYTDDI